MILTATVLPFTENQLWLMKKDRLLAQTFGCDAGHDLYPREAESGWCPICASKGEDVGTFDRGF